MRCVALVVFLASLQRNLKGHALRVQVDHLLKKVIPDPSLSSKAVELKSEQGLETYTSKMISLLLGVDPHANAHHHHRSQMHHHRQIQTHPHPGAYGQQQQQHSRTHAHARNYTAAEKTKEGEPGVCITLLRIVQGASQGAVAAVIAATLYAAIVPIVNRILVLRLGVWESIMQHTLASFKTFFVTVLPANFLKFPFFESLNAVMEPMGLSIAMKGLLVGVVYTSVTLPVANYLTEDEGPICQAYFPTLLRDVIYAIARNQAQASLNPSGVDSGMYGAASTLSVVVLVSCIISSPANELRIYRLQPPKKRTGCMAFFNPVDYVCSTCVISTMMAISLGLGSLVTASLKLLLATF